MAHMSRREYRMKKEHNQTSADQARVNYSRNQANSREAFRNKKISNPAPLNTKLDTSREDYHQVKLNFWTIFSDRPYVSVAIIVLAYS